MFRFMGWRKEVAQNIIVLFAIFSLLTGFDFILP